MQPCHLPAPPKDRPGSPMWPHHGPYTVALRTISFIVTVILCTPEHILAHAAILVDCDAPIIGTLPSPIQLFMKQGRSMVLNRHETDQMQSRVTYLNFSYSLIERDRSHAIECKACVRCGARLYLEGRDDASVEQASTAAMRDRSRSR